MKKEPIRQCVGCGEARPKAALVRIVKAPDATVFLDRSGKANGRGAYICHNSECYKKAIKNRRFEKAFSMAIPEEVSAQIIKEIEENEQ